MAQVIAPTPELQAAQAARQQRAQEGDFYIFPDLDDEFTFHCLNPKSGGHYRVGPDSCSCPDHARRGAHVVCKHRLAVEKELADEVRYQAIEDGMLLADSED